MNQHCKQIHRRWFQLRKDLEQSWGYQEIPKSGWRFHNFLGYCKEQGELSYVPLKLPLSADAESSTATN